MTRQVCVVLACLCSAHSQPAAKKSAADEIDRLIKQLGHAAPAERDAATKALLLREDAIAKLRQALKAQDLEVARRANLILNEILARPHIRHVEKAKEFAAQGRVDLVCEHLARVEKGKNEEACWKVYHELMSKIAKTAAKINPDHVAPGRLPQFDDRDKEIVVASSFSPPAWKNYWVRTKEFSFDKRIQKEGFPMELHQSMIIATGGLRDPSEGCQIFGSYLYAGQSVSLSVLRHCVVVADGAVDCSLNDIANSVIISRGPIGFRNCVNGGPSACTIISRETVRFDQAASPMRCVIEEKQSNALEYLRFFEVSDLGLHVIQNDTCLAVFRVEKDSVFHAAGLRCPVYIVGANGKEVRTYEAFRRIVRDSWVENTPLVLDLKDSLRGSNTEAKKLRVEWK